MYRILVLEEIETGFEVIVFGASAYSRNTLMFEAEPYLNQPNRRFILQRV